MNQSFSRRQVLTLMGSAGSAAVVIACSGSSSPSVPTTTPVATSTGAAGTPIATGTAAASAVTPKIVAAATAFVALLSSEQKSTGMFAWTNTAQKQKWSNFPNGIFQRSGLMWGNLSDAQRAAWLDLMRMTLSTEGYGRVLAEWNADQALASQGGGGGSMFGTNLYYIALIGEPSATSPWQWQWGGHHVTVNATIAGTHLAVTPSFIGVQPATYRDSAGKSVTPLGDIADDAFALLNALDSTKQSTAIRGSSVIDLVLGPGQDGKTLAAEGLPGSQMDATQQAAFLKLIGHYSNLSTDADAALRMTQMKADLASTYFAWFGPKTKAAAYFRVTGPTIVIEYSPQNSTDHVHGIYRDPTNDYGKKYAAGT